MARTMHLSCPSLSAAGKPELPPPPVCANFSPSLSLTSSCSTTPPPFHPYSSRFVLPWLALLRGIRASPVTLMACRAGSRLSRAWSEASSSSSYASSATLLRAAPAPLRLRHPGPSCLRCYSDASAQAERNESGGSSGPAKNALKDELPGSSAPVTKSELKRAGFLDEAISAEYRATASGKLIRRRIPRATLTLEEFRKLKPRAPKISPMRGKDKRDFEAAKQDAAWQRTFDEISAALGVEQLRQLVKTAGLTTSHQAKKTELINVLLKDQFNLLSPQERQRMEKEERVDRRIPVSKTELFLLLVNGGYSLGALAQQTGLTLKPDAKAEEGKAVEYAIVASGQEKALGSILDEKMQLFRRVSPVEVQNVCSASLIAHIFISSMLLRPSRSRSYLCRCGSKLLTPPSFARSPLGLVQSSRGLTRLTVDRLASGSRHCRNTTCLKLSCSWRLIKPSSSSCRARWLHTLSHPPSIRATMMHFCKAICSTLLSCRKLRLPSRLG